MSVKICDLLAGHDCMVGGREGPKQFLRIECIAKRQTYA